MHPPGVTLRREVPYVGAPEITARRLVLAVRYHSEIGNPGWTMLTNRRRRWNGEQGAEIIEFAVVFPLLMMVILGCVDFAWCFSDTSGHERRPRRRSRCHVARIRFMDVENPGDRIPPGGRTPGRSPGNPVIVVDQGANVDPCVLPPRSTCGTFAPSAWPATMVTVTYDHDYMFIGAISHMVWRIANRCRPQSSALMRHELR